MAKASTDCWKCTQVRATMAAGFREGDPVKVVTAAYNGVKIMVGLEAGMIKLINPDSNKG